MIGRLIADLFYFTKVTKLTFLLTILTFLLTKLTFTVALLNKLY